MSERAELMSRLRFTADDLEANQAGTLSDTQEERMRQQQSRLLLIGTSTFIAAVFLATLFLFVGQRNQSLVLSIIGVLLTMVNALWIGSVARQWMRLSADLRENKVDVLDGVLERILRPTRYGQNYVVRIAGQDFAVDKETFKVFQHQAPYRFYRTPHMRTLLSVVRYESEKEKRLEETSDEVAPLEADEAHLETKSHERDSNAHQI